MTRKHRSLVIDRSENTTRLGPFWIDMYLFREGRLHGGGGARIVGRHIDGRSRRRRWLKRGYRLSGRRKLRIMRRTRVLGSQIGVVDGWIWHVGKAILGMLLLLLWSKTGAHLTKVVPRGWTHLRLWSRPTRSKGDRSIGADRRGGGRAMGHMLECRWTASRASDMRRHDGSSGGKIFGDRRCILILVLVVKRILFPEVLGAFVFMRSAILKTVSFFFF